MRAWVALCLTATAAGDVSVSINPRATYLRTNSDNGSIAATPLTLSALGIAPGDTVRLERFGGFRARTGGNENENSGMIAVFSSTSTLLAANLPHRVPGAVDAGVDIITPPTYFGRVETDIPQDFMISDSVNQVRCIVTVPQGAVYLFVCAFDTLYYDNGDQDGDFRVEVGLACAGDFNGDGFLDFFDYDDFVRCFESADCPAGRTADFNGDGFADFFDYDDFVEAFEGGC